VDSTNQTDWQALARQQWPELKIRGTGPFAVLNYSTMFCTLFDFEMEAANHGHVFVLEPPAPRRAFRKIHYDE
jgi:hypothetical protein